MSTSAVSARRQRTRDPVLAAVAHLGTTTRAELSRLTGLSRSAVGDCVATLLAEGLLVEAAPDPATGGRGRRATALRLRPAPGVVLGIDLGHMHVSAAAATRDGDVLDERTAALDVDHRPDRALDLAAQLAHETLAAGSLTLGDVAAVAAGIPGPLDVREHTVRANTILTEWVGIDPAAELEKRLGRPVFVGNDADMGAIGEYRFGAAPARSDTSRSSAPANCAGAAAAGASRRWCRWGSSDGTSRTSLPPAQHRSPRTTFHRSPSSPTTPPRPGSSPTPGGRSAGWSPIS